MRLDQFMVKSNICSRQEAKQFIRKGRVNVNGKVCKDSAIHIKEDSDEIFFDGKRILYEEFRYFMLNKPAGCVSARKDGLSDTVVDLLKDEVTHDLFPVGRLDKDTEGLLLITNDGKLAHNLLSPRHHVDKCYYVEADKELSVDDMRKLEEGLDIGDDKITLPAEIKFLNSLEKDTFEVEKVFCYELTIHEGRFHQVKRMFEACGSKVLYLKRLSMGELMLDSDLHPGAYRRLTIDEVNKLKGNEKESILE